MRRIKRPKISVVIPTLNEEKVIGTTLQALSRQSFRDFEIIVSDCFSSDNTKAIARSYGARTIDTPIDGVTNGTSRARNNGAQNALGDILIFMDADCLPSENLLSAVYHSFQRKDIVLVSCWNESARYYPLYSLILKWQFYASVIFSHFGLIRVSGWLIATRKILFDIINGFDESYVLFEDHEFSERLSRYGKVLYLRNVSVKVDPRRFEEWGLLKTYTLYGIAELSNMFSVPIVYNYPPVRENAKNQISWKFVYKQFRLFLSLLSRQKERDV